MRSKNITKVGPNSDLIEFIGKKTRYDDFAGGYIWGEDSKGGDQMIGEVRGWGAIQNLFKTHNSTIDFDAAEKFQDRLGNFISDAINEKINREL